MKLRTTLMIVLMLFHTTTVWALSMPVSQCPEKMQSMSAAGHAMHAMMPSEAGSSLNHDCCDGDMDDLACQLHCASVAAAIMQTPAAAKTSELISLVTDVKPAHRLPPHNLSLLRPPKPLS